MAASGGVTEREILCEGDDSKSDQDLRKCWLCLCVLNDRDYKCECDHLKESQLSEFRIPCRRLQVAFLQVDYLCRVEVTKEKDKGQGVLLNYHEGSRVQF